MNLVDFPFAKPNLEYQAASVAEEALGIPCIYHYEA